MTIQRDEYEFTKLKHPTGKEYGIGVANRGGVFFVVLTWGKAVQTDGSTGQVSVLGPYATESAARTLANGKQLDKLNGGYRHFGPRVTLDLYDLSEKARIQMGELSRGAADAGWAPQPVQKTLAWALSTRSHDAMEFLIEERSRVKERRRVCQSALDEAVSTLEIIEARIRSQS